MRASQLALVAPNTRRASHGSPASITTAATTSTRLINVAGLAAAPGQTAQISPAAAARNTSEDTIRRGIRASLASSGGLATTRLAARGRAQLKRPTQQAAQPGAGVLAELGDEVPALLQDQRRQAESGNPPADLVVGIGAQGEVSDRVLAVGIETE